MYLKRLEINGFKSFAKKGDLEFSVPIVAIVGPNGSGKSNVAEAFRFVLGEQSMKSMRGKRGEDLIFNGGKNLPKMNRASVGRNLLRMAGFSFRRLREASFFHPNAISIRRFRSVGMRSSSFGSFRSIRFRR
jgi:chromosome segregation protein